MRAGPFGRDRVRHRPSPVIVIGCCAIAPCDHPVAGRASRVGLGLSISCRAVSMSSPASSSPARRLDRIQYQRDVRVIRDHSADGGNIITLPIRPTLKTATGMSSSTQRAVGNPFGLHGHHVLNAQSVLHRDGGDRPTGDGIPCG